MQTIYTSESVSNGHPDKVADQISDKVLDSCLHQDRASRVACEVFAGNGFILVGGEITTSAYIDVQSITRKLIQDIGYNDHDTGTDGNSIAVITAINEQSKDIARGVDNTTEKQQGAGDQGMMYGYACRETPELMPAPIMYAHMLMMKTKEIRGSGNFPNMLPDGKCQVSILYENNVPKRIQTIVFSQQHKPDVRIEQLREDIVRHIIKPVLEPSNLLDDDTIFHINPTGRFVIGGVQADTGLTGRKIMVDTYGGMCKHGGGAFSGKDPSKVDRSASYMARYIAKTIVAAELADTCEICLAYAIGVAEPVSIAVQCSGNTIATPAIEQAIRSVFDCTPAGIIAALSLTDNKTIQYAQTASFGHFGRSMFPWEQVDPAKITALQQAIS